MSDSYDPFDDTEPVDGEKPKKSPTTLFQKCEIFYDAMLAESHGQVSDADDGVKIYTGFVTRLFKEVGWAQNQYSRVVSHMQMMGCIRKLAQGAGPNPSVFVLIKRPDENESNLTATRFREQMATGNKDLVIFSSIRHLEGELEKLTQRVDEMAFTLSKLTIAPSLIQDVGEYNP
jgi:hypothetical protein